ncbi:MAG: hypothetical protein KDC46_14815 [Thermoleophilia bacterium]|nr:hypothetical protein [Thermoleophilia bacterium]
MSSPYSTSLLNETVETAAPRAPQHVRSVTHVVPQPVPAMAYAPQQPQVVYAEPRRSGGAAVTALALALVVILVGAVALIGTYYATRQASPTSREAGLMQGAAMRQGYSAGRERGVASGREQALQNAETTIALRTAAAREQAYSTAYAKGEKAGRNSYRRPTYRGYGYRAPRYSYGNRGLYSAFGTAQALANATGAAVDVEIY